MGTSLTAKEGNWLEARVPTFSFRLPGKDPSDVARRLAARNIAIWSGNFYAHEAAAVLGVADGGVNRIGFAHYNTPAEVETVIEALGEIARA